MSSIDLKLAPGQKEQVTFYIKNNTDSEMTLRLTGGTATTRENGKVNYVTGSQNVTGQVPYKVGDTIDIQSSVTIPAQGKTSVQGTITMPDQAFAGQLVGGVSFVRSTTSNTASEIPVILQNDTTPVKPVLKVGKASLNDLSADRVLGVTLSNKAKDATVTTSVTDKNDKVVYEKDGNVDIAPQSSFTFDIKKNIKSIKVGTYKVHVTVASGDVKTTETRTLKVTAAQVAQLAGQQVNSADDWKNPANWWKLLIWPIVVFVVVFLAGRYLLPKRRRKHNEPREDLKRKED
ncbi:WxL protein peptidoglycan domain-containing protein [Weissella confusa]|uniref:WxL protein peptidoglycan domain-containing protein n=1 Tax=Weissella confusa TaxID=1583 RepID=UPI0022E18565|nr:DUF916 domain-containing protein [Weissella confusa]